MVYRVYSEKKREHAVEAQSVAADLRENLGLTALREVRLLNRYDVENIPQDIFERAKKTVFSEPQVDEVYDTLPAFGADAHLLAVEYLPGQYDQRADSCAQCIQIMTQQERPLVSTAKVYVLVGELTEQEVQAAADYLINPVESRRADMAERASLQTDYEVPQQVATLDGFLELDQAGLADFVRRYGLAMDEDDIAFCQEYFRTEQRDPTMTEIRMIDTSWSDHCRHTTFLTRIDKVTVADGEIQLVLGDALALVLLDMHGFSKSDYGRLHPGGAIGRMVTTRAEDIMRKLENSALVSPGSTVRETIYAMSHARCGSAIITDAENHLLGIFTDGDFRRLAEKEDKVLEFTMNEVMTKNPVSIKKDALAVEVLKILEQRRIDDIVVTDSNGVVCGFIDVQDLPGLKIM